MTHSELFQPDLVPRLRELLTKAVATAVNYITI